MRTVKPPPQDKPKKGRKPLGDNKREVIKITLPPDQLHAARAVAVSYKCTLSEFIEQAIKEEIYRSVLEASKIR